MNEIRIVARRNGKLLSMANQICELINDHKTVAVAGVNGMHEVAPIVRCKDCAYLIDHPLFMDDGYCRKMRDEEGIRLKPDPDWFCASGEPRERR